MKTWAITQQQIDRLATFAEACVAAKREPFFGGDEEGNFRASQDWKKIAYTFGNRFHFRSALVPFSQLWLEGALADWRDVVQIIGSLELPEQLAYSARNSEAFLRAEIARTDAHGKIEISRERVLRLWFNVLMPSRQPYSKEERTEFESICKIHGHAAFEFAFRSAVKWVGVRLLEFYARSVEQTLPLLEGHQRTSFEPHLPGRTNRREVTSSGTMVLRTGIADDGLEESLEDRFQRLRLQVDNRSLHAAFGLLEASTSRMVLALIRSATIAEFLMTLGGRIEIEVFPANGWPLIRDPSTFRGSRGTQELRVVGLSDNVIVTDAAGAAVLDRNLLCFRERLLG